MRPSASAGADASRVPAAAAAAAPPPPALLLLRQWLSAGLANAATSALLHPLDVAKTRLQTLPPAGGASLRTVFREMHRAGGLAGCFLPGLSASMAREMLSSGVRAGFYTPLRDWLRSARAGAEEANGDFDDVDVKITAALGCGALGALLANPVDVVKVRLMLRPDAYPSARAALPAILRAEGARGLLKGLAPSTLRAAMIAVGELATYDVAKTALKAGLARAGGGREEGPALHVVASLITGAVAAVVAAPFDLLKSRAMADAAGGGGGAGGSSMRLVLRQLAREGGLPFSLFRGLLPAYLRLGPHALICFPLLEGLRAALGLEYL
jgi:hypothetical protein